MAVVLVMESIVVLPTAVCFEAGSVLTTQSRLRSKCFEQLRYVLGGFHIFQDSLYLLVGPDEVGGPFGNHALAVPDLIRFHKLLVRVAQQGKGQTMFFDEFLMTLRAIDADAEQFHFGLEFAPG